MSYKIDFGHATYDRTTRIIYDTLEHAIQASPTLTASELLEDLQYFDAGFGRFCNLENDSTDLTDEITKDLKGLGLDVETLNGKDYMVVDMEIQDALADGFGKQMAIADIAKRVYQRSLESITL